MIAGVDEVEAMLDETQIQADVLGSLQPWGPFILRNEVVTHQYLAEHRWLHQPLRETYRKIAEYFPDSEISLELVNDPEIIDTTEIVAWISTHLDIDEAFDRLQRLDNEWFLNVLDQFRNQFTINLDF